VPCGPLNDLEEVFADPQVIALDMRKTLPHRSRGIVSLVGNPVRLSAPPRVETAAGTTCSCAEMTYAMLESGEAETSNFG
jgi:crotonobetainyl-CoA:carnitine CoA-transferase CaiB-like acyl-CoA transferase